MSYKAENRPVFLSPKGGAPYMDPLRLYFEKYLLQMIKSVFKFGYPKTWTREQIRHFETVLFTIGYLGIFDTSKYGVVALACSFYGEQNMFYSPKQILVTNPVLNGVTKTIGKDCVLFTLQETPSFGGYEFSPHDTSVRDIVEFYATQMALATLDLNSCMINSQLAYAFFVDNKAAAEAMKKMYEQIASGEPCVTVDKNLLLPDGKPAWAAFQQNLSQNYIANDVLETLSSLNDEFMTKVGIPNANITKRERLIESEINANNTETSCLSDLWLENMKRCCDEVNEMFDIGLTVEKRYKTNDNNDLGEEDTGDDEITEP